MIDFAYACNLFYALYIERKYRNNEIKKQIEETISFCEIMDRMLDDGVDIDEKIDQCIIEVLNELIIIINCYKFVEDISTENDNAEVSNFEKGINCLIRQRIIELDLSID